ncbi:MAG: O-antigen ligase family protein [Rhodothermales bacterium]
MPSPLSAPRPTSPPTRGERAALRVLQLGALASVLLVVPYEPFELDRFFVPKEFVLHVTAALAGLLTLGAARRWRFARVDVLLAAFLVASAASTVFAANGWLATRALAVSASGVTVFWAARGVGAAGLGRPLLHALALAVVLAAVTALVQAYGFRPALFSVERAPGGTLGNRNFVGHFAALGLPLLLLAAAGARRPKPFLVALLGVALTAGALVLTRSRAAWLGLVVVLAVVLVGVAILAVRHRRRRFALRFVLALLVGTAGVGAALTLPNALRWTSDAPYLETAAGVANYREGSGRGRLLQYGTSLRMALADPVLGVGPGNWPVVYPAFAEPGNPAMDRSEAGRTANPWPSSDIVALLAERGLVGFLLFALAAGGLVLVAWRGLWRAPDVEAGTRALALCALLAATATVGAFDAVLLLAWPTLLVAAAVGALSPGGAPEVRVPGWARATALLVLTLGAGAAAVQSARQTVAMALYTADETRAGLERAARLDPGNYRVQLRLAQRSRNDREARCHYAQAARDLFPHAAEAARLTRGCE